MGVVLLEDIVLVGLVTAIAAYQQAGFARLVGKARGKFKVEPPEMNGPPEFIRTLRAQQNGIEFFGLFMSSLWMAGLFTHQGLAALAGLYYCYGRYLYVNGYIKDANERLPGFYTCLRALQILLSLTAAGLLHTALKHFLKFDIVSSGVFSK